MFIFFTYIFSLLIEFILPYFYIDKTRVTYARGCNFGKGIIIPIKIGALSMYSVVSNKTKFFNEITGVLPTYVYYFLHKITLVCIDNTSLIYVKIR